MGDGQEQVTRENYLKLVEENRSLKGIVDSYTDIFARLRREMLQERVWRIRFQIDYLTTVLRQTEQELQEMGVTHGTQAEGAVPGQD